MASGCTWPSRGGAAGADVPRAGDLVLTPWPSTGRTWVMVTAARPAADPSEFLGKRVLVTGGTKGAGKAIAERFLRGGGTVIVTARSEPAETAGRHFIPR